MKLPSKWIKIETEAFTSLKSLPVVQDHDEEVFRARSIDFDLRKAEALCLLFPTDALQELRTWIARGQMEMAQHALHITLDQNPELKNDPEWLMESARLEVFFHEWSKAFDDFSRVLELSPTPATRITTLQSRSVAAYESGQMERALHDINQIRSLGRLYPLARPVFYAEVLAYKIAALQGDASGVAKKLPHFWERTLKQQSPSLDLFLTLSRLEAHVLRCLKQDARSVLHASVSLARAMGDDLYAALGRFELWADGDRSVAGTLNLEKDLKDHPKVRLLHQEFLSEVPKSTSARVLKEFSGGGSEGLQEPSEPIQALILPQRSLILHLDPFDSISFAKLTRPFEALILMAKKSAMTKSDLFSDLFGGQKYAEHLHSALIHQILSRARKISRLNVRTRDSQVELQNVLLVKTT